MPRAKTRTPELRQRVLEAAVSLLADGGVAKLTTREVALAAGTSAPALYELFGDKSGLVRAMYFAGFERLAERLGAVPRTSDPRADIEAFMRALRAFARSQPALMEVMFGRPFSEYAPSHEDMAALREVYDAVMTRIRRCTEEGLLTGDATDIAHAFVATAHGLAAAENAGRLGSTDENRTRRWDLATRALLNGWG